MYKYVSTNPFPVMLEYEGESFQIPPHGFIEIYQNISELPKGVTKIINK